MDTKKFQKLLLTWYGKNKRDLPWRKTKDPYKIWVSEIMLQQTQVDTVIPYYEKWIKKFPSIEKLARAKEETVLKFWQGLGYYRRARMLHKAAKEIIKDHGGNIPSDLEAIQKLPGIGQYTAGAILSIAFEKKVPVLDGNVIRILTRILGISKSINDPITIKSLWKLSESTLPEKNIGDFNQSLMELGATICSPQIPQCSKCPVKDLCYAYKKKEPLKYPVKTETQKLIPLHHTALILKNKDDKVCIKKQLKGERWESLWAFPFSDDQKNLEKKFKVSLSGKKKKIRLQHGFTKYKITLDAYELSVPETCNEPEYKWVPKSKLKNYAFPSPHQKIIDKCCI